jgi:AcrR family transcriptional regulator
VPGRADRILDAAGTLLLRLGYRKVTIEDIARQAGVGKGTIYLHWRTKDQLFTALMLRESADLVEELLGRIRSDPAEAAPNRFLRGLFLATVTRPLIMALFSGDAELLGQLTDHPLRSKDLVAGDQFFALMTKHHLLRDDIPNLRYAMQAASTGFYLLETLNAEGAGLPLEEKGDALAHTIKAGFEPAGEPPRATLEVIAPVLAGLFEDLASDYRKSIHAQDPEDEPG